MNMMRSCVVGALGLFVGAVAVAVSPVEEAQAAVPIPVTTLADSGPGSLRSALLVANGNAAPDVIDIQVSGTILLTSGGLSIFEGVDIIGPGSDQLTIDGNDSWRILDSNVAGVDLTIEGLTFANGASPGPGGGLRVVAGDELTLVDVVFDGNVATGDGGGLSFAGATGRVDISESVFRGNMAGVDGGGIAGDTGLTSGNILLQDVVIDDNQATSGDGGGVWLEVLDRGVDLKDVEITNNRAPAGSHGGITADGGRLFLVDSLVSGNESDSGVGGVDFETTTSNIAVDNTIVSNNRSTDGQGGAGLRSGSWVHINGSTFADNDGQVVGGLFARSPVGEIRLIDSRVTGNSAINTVGAMYVANSLGLTIETTTIADNTAPVRAGLVVTTTDKLTLDRSTVSGNVSSGIGNGSGVFVSGAGASVAVTNSTISGNSTGGHGAGFFNDAGVSADIHYSTITGNSAAEGGGVASGALASVGFYHTIVADNTAPTAPDIRGTVNANFLLVGDSSGATVLGAGNPTDIAPLLGPLANNGGPTLTHLPAEDSPAIDAGTEFGAGLPSFDQRGVDRLVGDRVDIGAVETRAADFPEPEPEPGGLVEGASRYVGLDPVRVFDSREGEVPSTGPKGLVGPDGFVDVGLLGVGGVPGSGVSAVLVNVTTTEVAGPSFVSAIPTPAGAASVPSVSSVNVPVAGLTRSNLAVVPVGVDGRIRLFSKAASHVVLDVFGYFETTEVKVADGRIVPVDPFRLFDTRPGEPAPGPKGLVPDAGSISPAVLGVGPVPDSGVSAVVVNVTATEVAGPSFVTVWPEGPVASTSSLNVSGAGETVSNTVVVPVGGDGSISLFTLRSAHLLGDVVGYVTDESAAVAESGLFVPLEPGRLFDTREGELPDVAPKGMLPGEATLVVEMPGRAGLPDHVGMVLMNLTATQAITGYLTVFPFGAEQPLASTLNPNPDGDTRANSTLAAVGDDQAVSFYTLSATHLLADTAGYTLP